MREPHYFSQCSRELFDCSQVEAGILEELWISQGEPAQDVCTDKRRLWYRVFKLPRLIRSLLFGLFDKWRYRTSDGDSLDEEIVVEGIDILTQAVDWVIFAGARCEMATLETNGQIYLGSAKIVGPKCDRVVVSQLKERLLAFRQPFYVQLGMDPVKGDWRVKVETHSNGAVSVVCTRAKNVFPDS
jgi:hypothetical protein